MTLIAAWAGLDGKKDGPRVASIYFASDSRFSWSTGKHYDEGRKVFCSLKYPYIFAYCGDVTFPLNSIERIIDKIDCDMFFPSEHCDFKEKLETIAEELRTSLNLYPFPNAKFTILVASRESTYCFHVGKIVWKSNQLLTEELELPKSSGRVFWGGSGLNDFEKVFNEETRNNNLNVGTSRFYYQCIAKTIREYESDTVGGTPQLVGLFRKGPGRIFGIISGNNRYILGKKVNNSPQNLQIEWRNDNFEVVDPETMKLKDGYQAQPF